jgi:hypothetical protein
MKVHNTALSKGFPESSKLDTIEGRGQEGKAAAFSDSIQKKYHFLLSDPEATRKEKCMKKPK